jgi:hypothetical protein
VLAPCCHHELSTLLDEAAAPAASIPARDCSGARFCDLATDAFRAGPARLHGYRAAR